MRQFSSPLVTIITPSFNQAQFIGATVQSVLSQDYPHLQYLVIDGGSTDGTLDVLRACTDPRLTWVSEPDRGQSDAINKGLRLAKGDIIAYLNSDDLYLPGAIAHTVAQFEQHPQADVIYGDVIFIDEHGTQIGQTYGEPFDLPTVLTGQIYAPQQSAFWRRRVTDAIGEFDATLHYVMDVDYWLRLVAAGFTMHYAPGLRAAYRLHHSSKTVSQVEGFWREWERIITKFFALPDLPSDMQALQTRVHTHHLWMYTLYAPWKQGYRAELRPLLSRILRGRVPLRHRVLAAFMLTDTYLGTSLANTVLRRVQGAKTRAKLPEGG